MAGRASLEELGREVALLSLLRCPQVAQYYGATVRFDRSEERLWLFQELVEGKTLAKLVKVC